MRRHRLYRLVRNGIMASLQRFMIIANPRENGPQTPDSAIFITLVAQDAARDPPYGMLSQLPSQYVDEESSISLRTPAMNASELSGCGAPHNNTAVEFQNRRADHHRDCGSAGRRRPRFLYSVPVHAGRAACASHG
jgi:hypothetical protein